MGSDDSSPAIRLRGLTRDFGPPGTPRLAVDALDLDVPAGSVFGFLGANGAGKTTTIRAIVGHLRPTWGLVRTLGADPWELDPAARRRLAYVSEAMRLPAWMDAAAAIAFCAAQYPAWDSRLARHLVRQFELEADTPFRALSTGQQRRLCLLLALCQGADLLVLDEPASGLDVEARRALLDQILEIACAGGRTVFISSHILGDLERVVDRIAILRRGRLITQGDLEELKARVRTLRLPAALTRAEVESGFSVLRFDASGPEAVAVVADFDPERFEHFCTSRGIEPAGRDFGLALEDLYLELNKEPVP